MTTITDEGREKLAALIRERFKQCDDCGKLLNPDSPRHRCPNRSEQQKLVSNKRREDRQCRIDADNNPGDVDVLTIDAAGRRSAYHLPVKLHDPPRIGCGTNTSHEPEEMRLMTRAEAQNAGKYPCNRCYPAVARRAVELYELRFGVKPQTRNK